MLCHAYSKQTFSYSSSQDRGKEKYAHWSVWKAPDQWVFLNTFICNSAVYSSINSTACLLGRGKWPGNNGSPLESVRNWFLLPSLWISASQDGKLVGGKGTILLNSLSLFLQRRSSLHAHTCKRTQRNAQNEFNDLVLHPWASALWWTLHVIERCVTVWVNHLLSNIFKEGHIPWMRWLTMSVLWQQLWLLWPLTQELLQT